MAVRRYRHRDGFGGSVEGAEYVEANREAMTLSFVWPEGKRMSIQLVYDEADIQSWLDMGWWIPYERNEDGKN